MELSCDEAVMRKMNTDMRAEYSQSLLRVATGRKIIPATPLALGEGDRKGRVKHVLNYKKPAFWVVAIALVSATFVAVGLMSNPKSVRPPILYAYSENAVIPMNLGTYSWNGVVADAIPYPEMDYENVIAYYEGHGQRYANIFFSTSNEPAEFNTDHRKGRRKFKIVEMRRYVHGKEEILEEFDDHMIEVSLETDASYFYQFKIQFGDNYGYYSLKINRNVLG